MTMKQLLAQRAELDAKIKEAEKEVRKEAIAQAREIVAKFDLLPGEVFKGRGRKAATTGRKVPPKYRNPQTGETWTGRGKEPRWIAGRDRTPFKI